MRSAGLSPPSTVAAPRSARWPASARAAALGRRDRVVTAVVALTLAAATAAPCLARLDMPFWQDEVATARVVQKPTPRAALRQIVVREATPPAYYATAWVAERIRDHTAPEAVPGKWLRLLSVAFAIGTTLATFAIGLRLLPLVAAAVAALVTGLASELVFHGAELRAYSLLAFASTLLALCLLRAAERPSAARLGAVVAVTAVGSMTHYFFLLTVASGMVWAAVAVRPLRTVARLGCAVAVGLVPLAAWTPYAWRQHEVGGYSTSAPFALHRVPAFIDTLFVPTPLVGDAGSAARVGALLLVLVAAAAMLRRRDEGLLVGILVLLPPAATLLAGALGERILNTRNLVSVAPFAAIAVTRLAAAIPLRPGRWVALASIAALLAGVAGYSATHARRAPYDTMARTIVAQGYRPGDPIVWFGAWGGHIPFGWYLSRPPSWAQTPTGMLIARSYDEGACRAVFVVVRGPRGAKWLREHREDVTSLAVVRLEGGSVFAHPGDVDARIVRARWAPGLLAGAARAGGTTLYAEGHRPRCA